METAAHRWQQQATSGEWAAIIQDPEPQRLNYDLHDWTDNRKSWGTKHGVQSSSSHWFCADRTYSRHSHTDIQTNGSAWVQTSKTICSTSINYLQQKPHRITMTPCCLHLHHHIRWKDSVLLYSILFYSILFYICSFILHTFTKNTSGQIWKRTHQKRRKQQM